MAAAGRWAQSPNVAAAVDRRPPAVLLMGPTASGKTDLAIALARRFPLGLVSADSALVYRGLDIGAAKPDRATLARWPHALVDIRDPDQPFSAGEFRHAALSEMARISAAGDIPLLVGGTGLYFRALTRGLADLPAADPALRERLAEEGERLGWPALHARLARVDPSAAHRIRPSDPQRIQRALEVWHLTGQPISTLQQARPAAVPYRLLRVALLPADRAALHRRIATRCDLMLEAGLLDEVRRLRADPTLHPDLPALRAVGYRQAWRHLDGVTDLESFRRETIEATRQLAKRQFTWFRGERAAFLEEPFAPDLEGRCARRLSLFLGPARGKD
ncbi:MAG: tRNA (adenosine(37)-N6)-dimethylallyltransferase MiaA [Xanthomonadales bacterium]|nr:tRNA (adenosine(37)-N6)-dimethylallyltransferase MiaA [Xanthomonadales bacterium]